MGGCACLPDYWRGMIDGTFARFADGKVDKCNIVGIIYILNKVIAVLFEYACYTVVDKLVIEVIFVFLMIKDNFIFVIGFFILFIFLRGSSIHKNIKIRGTASGA